MSDGNTNPTAASLTGLLALSRAAGGLRLNTRRVLSRQSGQYLSSIKGRGMEFDESRPYQPGDDVRNIDWPVTARSGKTHTKIFREERERPVLISVDARASMFFATQGRYKSVVAAELAALVAWAAHQQGDRIGGEIYNEDQHTEFRPRRGQQNILRLLKQLASSRASTAAPTASLEAPLRRLLRITHPGSMVCVISDFRGLNESAVTQLINVSRHNEVLLAHVYDPLEASLPGKGFYRVSYGERTLNLNAANQRLRRRYAERFRRRFEQLQQLSRSRRMGLLHCKTNESPIAVLRDRFGMRSTAIRGAV